MDKNKPKTDSDSSGFGTISLIIWLVLIAAMVFMPFYAKINTYRPPGIVVHPDSTGDSSQDSCRVPQIDEFFEKTLDSLMRESIIHDRSK